ncbi:hypothetical protein EVAR_60844_1 [Eumeta japonica]|uniref:Uncharacterized protein n=1 Tax=Eumeta variegata TaxID=151549 RepID=A0A4C1Y9I7_EUMVA|nr:hypothetical protein EVAR_60844_1 [Eumeta japonica]
MAASVINRFKQIDCATRVKHNKFHLICAGGRSAKLGYGVVTERARARAAAGATSSVLSLGGPRFTLCNIHIVAHAARGRPPYAGAVRKLCNLVRGVENPSDIRASGKRRTSPRGRLPVARAERAGRGARAARDALYDEDNQTRRWTCAVRHLPPARMVSHLMDYVNRLAKRALSSPGCHMRQLFRNVIPQQQLPQGSNLRPNKNS